MKTFDVIIRGTVTKTIRVEADDIQQAIEDAHDQFNVGECNFYEDYDEETVSAKEVQS